MKQGYKYKNTALIIILCTIVLSLMLGGFFLPKKERSESERRPLARLPGLSLEVLLSGELMSDLEKYSTDHLPARESLRRLKSIFVYSVFMQKENNGIAFLGDYQYKADDVFKPEGIDRSAEKLKLIYEQYLEKSGCLVYLSLIPDKGYFARQEGLPGLDYSAVLSKLRATLDFSYIDLTPLLSLEDYYRTDIHLRQERSLPIAELLAKNLGKELTEHYSVFTSPEPFYGVYYGQAALPVGADELKILTSDLLEGCTVTDYEAQASIGIYDMEALKGRDPYEVFLSGSKSLLEIKNPEASGKGRLIIFRDSFASALAPLLAEAYESIFLVDVRYISPAILDKFIAFQASDTVLFLYSTPVLNLGL